MELKWFMMMNTMGMLGSFSEVGLKDLDSV